MDVADLAKVEDARTRRLKVIEAVASMGMTRDQAAAYAGVKKSTVTALLKDERVQQYIRDIQEAHAKRLNVRREQVIEGILEAIEGAKMTNEPAVQIRGWEAIAKMQGYNAPERHIHDIPDDTKRLMEAMQDMSDEQIAQMAGMDNLIELRPGEDYQEASDG
jgi:transcriptional regulator with XRE-family HTH domain